MTPINNLWDQPTTQEKQYIFNDLNLEDVEIPDDSQNSRQPNQIKP